MYSLTGEHYAIDDDCLPILALHPTIEVRIDIEETGVKLIIGPREYEWPRGCPDVCSVRTGFCSPLDGAAERRFVVYRSVITTMRLIVSSAVVNAVKK